MSKIDVQRNVGTEPPSPRPGMAHFLWQQLPYVVALVLAIAGVAYTNVSHQPLVGYWEFLALAICVVCVVTKWPEAQGKEAQLRLIWTQALHWIAVLVTMNIILISGVQQLLPTPATGLVLLTLLALGTFLAGVSLAISWLKQSVFFFLLGAVLLIGLGITFWLRQDSRPRIAPSDTNSQVEA